MASLTFSRRQISEMDKVHRLKLINAVSGYKSANLISTVNTEGCENVAIFSSVVHVGSNPPLLGCICITRPETVPRHTYQNIKETGWYTINHVHSGIYEQAHQTSGKFRKNLSEFEQCELSPLYSDHCPAPYVSEAHIRMGMQFVEEHHIEANGTILVVGSIEEIIMTNDFRTQDSSLDLEKAGTVTISGIEQYHTTRRLETLGYVRVPEELRRA